jgi:hypothetical protein
VSTSNRVRANASKSEWASEQEREEAQDKEQRETEKASEGTSCRKIRRKEDLQLSNNQYSQKPSLEVGDTLVHLASCIISKRPKSSLLSERLLAPSPSQHQTTQVPLQAFVPASLPS